MINKQNLLSGKRKYVFGMILLGCVSIICAAFSFRGGDDYIVARREILLRKVGDQLLTQSGDAVSRVLPIKKIGTNEYQISFEQELTFQPDSLVNTTHNLFAKEPLANDYIITVLNAKNSSVAYGFAIAENKKDDIISCKGRVQPKSAYVVDVKFKHTATNIFNKGYLLGSFSFLALLGFVFYRSVKPQKKVIAKDQSDKVFNFGAVQFDAENRKLTINETTTDLTGTETRLLNIFAMMPNEIIERSRLQKEIWEDEGVIVGRSLDMFISKLRKKLEADPNVKIAVVRGKGYKLEVTS